MTLLYCVIQSDTTPAMPDAGLPGAEAPRALPIAKGLAAIVSTVRDDEFEPEAVSTKLGDMDWVSKAAVAHAHVLEHMMATATAVLPMKLLTLFSSDARLTADLKQQRARLTKAAARVAGCQEFGLRVNAVEANEPALAGERPSSGLAFLERKKEVRDLAREQVARRAAFAREAWDALADAARDAVERPIPADAIERPLLDAAFLVGGKERAAFAAASERLRAEADAAGCAFVLTGPWPAYHFVGGE